MAFIAVARDAGVARITLDRPDVLNSFNSVMAAQMCDALDAAASDAAVRAVLLTGAGRAFCAGQDLAEDLPKDGQGRVDIGEHLEKTYNPIVRKMRALEKPIVCAVNGVAAGAGANIALASDFVIASDKASFIQAFCKIGLIPDSSGTFFLPRLVGMARATEMAMLGGKVTAEQAHGMGMIFRVVAAEELESNSSAFAADLAKQPTMALGLIKRALNKAWENDLSGQLDVEAELQRAAGQSDDFQEGVNAFLEKRAPEFKGR